MREGVEKARLTPLLSNQALERLERLRINATRRFISKSRGEHLSGKGGRSIEFSDYRDYVPGDDVRFVDWNAFARLNRPYMKLYHQEEQMNLVLMVDASASMAFEEKLDRAKELGAAFCAMGLVGAERVCVCAFNARRALPRQMRPCMGRASMIGLFRFIEAIEAGGDQPVEEGIEAFLRLHAGRGVAVVLSDFLTFGDVERAVNRIFSAGLEIFGIQILGPSEISPEVAGDLRLVDSETESTLDVSSAGDLVPLYEEYRTGYERRLAVLCQQRCGRFVSISSDRSLEWVLFDLLRRRGWLK